MINTSKNKNNNLSLGLSLRVVIIAPSDWNKKGMFILFLDFQAHFLFEITSVDIIEELTDVMSDVIRNEPQTAAEL